MKQKITESIIKKECHDCGSKKDLIHLIYEDDGEIDVYRCQECFNEDETLSDYKECLVYSRIVGYHQPISQWNEGKRQEYKERKTFTR